MTGPRYCTSRRPTSSSVM